ncbi:MAG: outer membrane protein assembly factor BamB [Gammaproteobacteria bacterium]|jgi:outer membrane protein assembly factor BamB|nr:outer membrane protein assembly factor BamB [Gammaproteobacteria bacterium]
MKKLTILFCAVLLVSACSRVPLIGKKDDKAKEVIPELPVIQATVQLTRLWAQDAGKVDPKQFAGLTPALAEGRIYVSDADGNVSALDATSGKRLWRSELKQPVTGAVGLGSGLALVGTGRAEVIALDAGSGAERWRGRVSSEVLSAPAASGDMVVVRSADGKVAGLDAATGKTRWIYERSVPGLSLRGTSRPAIYGSAVFDGFASGKLVANELASGRVMWEADVANPRGRNEIERLVDVDMQPRISQGRIFSVAFQGNVVAHSARTGQLLWTRRLSSHQEVGAGSERLLVASSEGDVVALRQDNGEVLWTQSALAGRHLTGPVVVGQYAVVGDGEGYLHALNLADGSLVGQVRAGSKDGLFQPVSDDERVYVLDRSGELAAFTVRPR